MVKIFFCYVFLSILNKIGDVSRLTKRAKLKSSDEIKQINPSTSSTPLRSSIYPTTTTVAVPLSCLINPNSQQQSTNDSNSFTIDLNSLKNNGMNIVLTSPSHPQSSLPSDTPLVLTLGHFPYHPS